MRIVGGANRIRTERSNDEFMMFKPFFHQSFPDVQRGIRGHGISNYNVGNMGQFILIMTRALSSSLFAHSIQMRSFSYSNIIYTSYFGSGNLSRRFSSEVNLNRHNNDYPASFSEWLSGIIDGDGHLRLDRGRYPQLIITMGTEDFPLVEYIQTELGTGAIYRDSRGTGAYQYRIRNRPGISKVIQCINGHIRNSVRVPQLRRVCDVLGIPFQAPIELTAQSNWFAGFWDADGTMGIYAPAKQAPQLRISIANKHRTDLEAFHRVFRGHIYYNKSNDTHEWRVESRNDLLRLLAYYNENMFKSRKSRRIMLIDEFYRLKDLRAYRTLSPHYQDWQTFKHRWDHFLC